jgi:hypothetical protein
VGRNNATRGQAVGQAGRAGRDRNAGSSRGRGRTAGARRNQHSRRCRDGVGCRAACIPVAARLIVHRRQKLKPHAAVTAAVPPRRQEASRRCKLVKSADRSSPVVTALQELPTTQRRTVRPPRVIVRPRSLTDAGRHSTVTMPPVTERSSSSRKRLPTTGRHAPVRAVSWCSCREALTVGVASGRECTVRVV